MSGYQEFQVTLEYDPDGKEPWLLAISDDEVRTSWTGVDLRRGLDLVGRFIASSTMVREAD